MRDIKFRIWHKPTKRYVTMYQEDWSYGKGEVKYNNSGDFLAISHDGFLCHEGYDNGAANVEDSENYIVQQYTGLKDKNGVEIYEGDILLWEQGWMYPEMNGEIQWVENGYHFVQPEHNVEWLITQKSLSTAKIIGNIFEGVYE